MTSVMVWEPVFGARESELRFVVIEGLGRQAFGQFAQGRAQSLLRVVVQGVKRTAKVDPRSGLRERSTDIPGSFVKFHRSLGVCAEQVGHCGRRRTPVESGSELVLRPDVTSRHLLGRKGVLGASWGARRMEYPVSD